MTTKPTTSAPEGAMLENAARDDALRDRAEPVVDLSAAELIAAGIPAFEAAVAVERQRCQRLRDLTPAGYETELQNAAISDMTPDEYACRITRLAEQAGIVLSAPYFSSRIH